MLEYNEPQPVQQTKRVQHDTIVGLNKIHVGTIESSGFGSMSLPIGWSASVGGAAVTITHNLGHTNYVFAATVWGSNRALIQYYHASGMSVANSANSLTLNCFAVSGSNVNVDFDFILIGYAKPN